MDVKDYYATLGVERDATAEDVKKAYRRLAFKWHPDRHRGEDVEEAETRFKEIAEAYEVLGDDEKRSRYDELLAGGGRVDDAGLGGAREMSPEEFAEIFGSSGFSDFFARYFGEDLARGHRARAHPRYEHRGADAKAVLEVPVGLAARGGESTFDIAARVTCQACGGAGVVDERHVCPACAGIGHLRRRRTVTVKIPPGVRPGQSLRLRGLGEPARSGGTPGDLHLEIAWAADEVFEIDGDDLEAELPLAPWELLGGRAVEIRTPTDTITLEVPPGVRPGQRLRVAGQGLPRDGGRGDLYARITLALPRELSAKQKELLIEAGRLGGVVRGGMRP